MKTMTIRDLRQRWPEAEAALKVEHEILITRDAQPVATLVRVATPETRRQRWNPEAHAARIKRITGNRLYPSIDPQLLEARGERKV